MNERILGNYRVLKEIGAGGMARIYLAVHQDIPTLKVILKIVSDPQLAVRFKNEAEKLALLEGNPSVCKIKHFFNHGNDFVIAMEYIEGETLEKKIREAGSLKVKDAVQITCDLLDVLGFAHERGVYHRDIKPSNLMFDTAGKLKIIDFGIAKGETDPSLTGVDVYVGSPAYMAPEQFSTSKDHNWAKADIYAVGTTLYEMLTGERPFRGDDLFLLRDAKVFSRPPKPRNLRPEISRHLENVILTALEKDPANRFTSVQEMKEALLADPRRYSYTIQGVKTTIRRSNKGKMFGLVAALLIAAAAGAYFTVPEVTRWVDTQIERIKGTEPPPTVALAAPQLLFPADGGALATDDPHVFGWAPVVGARNGYRIEIADDSTFKTITISQQLTQTQYRTPAPLSRGGYFWRVITLGPGGSSGTESDPRRVTVMPADQAPERGQVIIASNMEGDLYVNDQLYRSGVRRAEMPLDTGTYTLRMESRGTAEKSISHEIMIPGDTTILQEFTFTRPQVSTVHVSTRPSGASVLVDGEPMRGLSTPVDLTLPPGDHTIGVSIEGKQPEYRSLSLKGSTDTSLFVNLQLEQDRSEIGRLQSSIDDLRSTIPSGLRTSPDYIAAEEAFARAEVSRKDNDLGSAITSYTTADSLLTVVKSVLVARETAVRAVLEQLRLAFEQGDIGRLKEVYPAMSDKERDGWRTFFDNAKNLSVGFNIDKIDINPTDADARISVGMQYEDPQGKKNQQFSWDVRLAEQDGRWLVVQRETN